MVKKISNLLITIIFAAQAAYGQLTNSDNVLYEKIRKTAYLHVPVPKPGYRDWLTLHKETGQSFKQYSVLARKTKKNTANIFYIQPIGKFNDKQQEILQLTGKYLNIFYQLPVRFLPLISPQEIPAHARRKNPHTKQPQVLSTYLLSEVLKKNFPKDAALVIGFTSEDLYPAPQWNFVFGQASLSDKVGVWSMSRFGDPSLTANYNLCLLRTFKTATHETGHMLGIYHCIAYHCNMGGSNHLQELDKKPVWFCPECLTKICWKQDIDPAKRYKDLERFWWAQKFRGFKKFYRKASKIVR
ncbi:archaemetzincin [uncultured Microscilla sp.]|uniref:archaemetzincin n=1 Tax=uncultured Microscilla sp. TaxID=432653 RepID=UPI00262AFDDB|nr:archaemetzincin [uncultured Microscilla sp.]